MTDPDATDPAVEDQDQAAEEEVESAPAAPDVLPANFEDIAALSRPADQAGGEDDPDAEQNTEGEQSEGEPES